MAQRVIIPRMGQTMTEGIVAKFYVRDGQSVEVGSDIYELEYDKSTATVTAKKAGTVRLLVKEGATVPLGEAIAVILEDGETLESVNIAGSYQVANAAKANESVPESAPGAAPVKVAACVSASPMVKRLAKDMGIEIENVTPTNGERITKEDLEAYAAKTKDAPAPAAASEATTAGASKASPLARKLAEELGVDITEVHAADGKRITHEDVQTFAYKHASAPAPAAPVSRGDRREPMRVMRKTIAARMSESYFTCPTVTLTTDADMFELMNLRTQLNNEFAKKGVKLTITDMLIKAVAKALLENEICNAEISGDEILYHGDINIGMAVGLDNGLLVPVIRNADQMTLEQISVETKRLIGLAKSGKLSGDDMSGGTFSITNLGMSGIDCFNPIINLPQSAILGIGRTVEKPVVLDGKITIRPRAVLSITHDHRIIDGVPAANFLKSCVHYIEKPFLLLLD